jgi:hypothetical protein
MAMDPLYSKHRRQSTRATVEKLKADSKESAVNRYAMVRHHAWGLLAASTPRPENTATAYDNALVDILILLADQLTAGREPRAILEICD